MDQVPYSALQHVPWYIMEPNALVVSIADEEQSGCDATPFVIVDRKEAAVYPNGQDGKDKADDCEQGNDTQTASVTPSLRHIGSCLIVFCSSLILLLLLLWHHLFQIWSFSQQEPCGI